MRERERKGKRPIINQSLYCCALPISAIDDRQNKQLVKFSLLVEQQNHSKAVCL